MLTFGSSLAVGILLQGMTGLVLCVTFNPATVSVLSHSVPYMTSIGSAGVYMLFELAFTVTVSSDKWTRRHIVYYVYTTYLVGSIFYGILFMARTLGTTDQIDVSLPVSHPRNVLEPLPVHSNPLPMILAFSSVIMESLRPFVSPLTAMPVAGDVVVHKWTEMLPAPPCPKGQWNLVFRDSGVHFAGVFFTMLGMFLAKFLNGVFNEVAEG